MARVYLPPDANCLLSVADHCLRSRDYVNLIVIDKQPQLQWLDIDAAREHCARGRSMWDVGGHRRAATSPTSSSPAPATSPTLETMAAAGAAARDAPDLRVRVVNVVDLMTLFPPDDAPARHAPTTQFVELFTADADVVFAFHGYAARAAPAAPRPAATPAASTCAAISEQGTTTTPVRHGRAQRDEPLPPRARGAAPRPPAARGVDRADRATARTMLDRHHAYVVEHLEDMPEVRDWTWA